MRTWCSWLRPAGPAVLLLGIVALAPGQAGPQKPDKKVVEAEAFILRDRQGNRRAELGLDRDGPNFSLYDGAGQRRVRLAVLADGSARLTFYDDKGKDRGVWHVGADGQPRFDLDKGGARPAGQGEPSPPPEPRSVVRPAVADDAGDKGEPLYKQYCASCHGSNGQGGRVRSRMPKIPDFTNARWQAGRSDAQLLAGILDGRGTDMPPFSAEVNAAQARLLVAFLRGFGPERATPAAAAAVSDFEQRLQQLQKQWEELDRQVKALADGTNKR